MGLFILFFRVCSNWYNIIRSATFWKQVEVLGTSSHEIIKIIPYLPPYVINFRIGGKFQKLPMSLPEILAKVQERCPRLQSFVLEAVCLEKYLHFMNPFKSKCIERRNCQRLDTAKRFLKEPLLGYLEVEYRTEEEIEGGSIILPELTILSFKSVYFNAMHLEPFISSATLPNIKVLDLSDSQPMNMTCMELFSDLVNLEELYIPKWTIGDPCLRKFLKYVKKLRVLDLEFTFIGDGTISSLKQNGKSLEALYLSYTYFNNLCNPNEETCFPQLRTLCIRHTKVLQEDIEVMLSKCPRLTCIDVSRCKDVSVQWYNNLSKEVKEKVAFETGLYYKLYCSHVRTGVPFAL